jgi:hypothetical protein
LDTIQRTGKSQSYYLLAVGVRWDIGMDLKRVAMRTLFLLWAQISVLSAQGPELYKAIAQYNPLAAEELINAGADPNWRDTHGRTPLHAAVDTFGLGKLKLMRLLLSKGADPNARDDSGSSPFDDAVWDRCG